MDGATGPCGRLRSRGRLRRGTRGSGRRRQQLLVGSRRRGTRSPEEEDAGEDDGDMDVDDGMEAIQFNHPSESVEDGDGVQEDMSKMSLRPSGRENDDERRQIYLPALGASDLWKKQREGKEVAAAIGEEGFYSFS